MTKIKIFFGLFFLLIMIGISYGALTDNLESYYKLDGNANDEVSGITGNISGATTNASCKIGGCYNFDGNNDVIQIGKRSFTDVTMCWWTSKNTTGYPSSGYRMTAGANGGDNIYFSTGYNNAHADAPTFYYAEDAPRYFNGYCSNLTVGTNWTHICVQKSGANAFIWVDGKNCSIGNDGAGTAAGTIAPTVVATLGNQNALSQFFLGSIDEFGLWKRVLTPAEIATLAGGIAYPFVTVSNTFVSQSPSDINSTNIFAKTLNVTYNISGGTNYSSIYLTYKINSTQLSCKEYRNMSCVESINVYNKNANVTPTSNVSNQNFLFSLFDNQVYPATYQYYGTEREMELLSKNTVSLNTSTEIVIMTLNNISNATQYNIFEAYINFTGSPAPLDIFYCNSSYVTGNVATNANCALFGQIANTFTYNHSHSNNSYHITIPMNIVSGMVGTTKVTEPSFFALKKSSSVGQWQIKYITNESLSGRFRISTNSGSSYSNLIGSPDFHIHQFGSSDKFCMISSYYESGAYTNSTERCDNLDLTPLPPSAVTFYSPNASIYANSLLINYSASLPSSGASITKYNILLCNSSFAYIAPIYNNSLNLSYNWSTVLTADGNYSICVDAYDNNTLVTRSFSQIFQIDKIAPVITFIDPANGSNKIINVSMTTDINIYDDNLFAYECALFDNNGILLVNSTQESVGTPNITVSMTITPNTTGLYTIECNASDGHTAKEIPIYDYMIENYKDIRFSFEKLKENKNYESENITIRYYSGDAEVSGIKLNKEKDRYNFEYSFAKRPLSPYMTITLRIMAKDLYYLQNSAYSAHFVAYSTKNWIDFNSDDLVKYAVTECGKDCYDVKMTLNNKDKVVFNSIGGLNYNTGLSYFNVINAPPTPFNVYSPDMQTIAGVLVFALFILLYLGLMVVGFTFRLALIQYFAFIIGLFISLMALSLNQFLAVVFFLINLFMLFFGRKE